LFVNYFFIFQALIDQLQGKVKSYKKQIEEAEEIAALNLAKYRKVAGALGDAEAVADANEQVILNNIIMTDSYYL
jgi:uncharacterized protein YbjQ (UPF0145 family)